MERMVRVDDHYQLWVEDRGDPRATPLLLIMGTNASGVAWPEPLIAQLAGQHWILRYDLPGPDPGLLMMWQHLADERDRDAEIAWRIEHWRLLNGAVLPFDPEEFRELEERIITHSGTWQNPAAHARADQSGLDRAAELAHVQVPTQVIEAPEDPINPPPHAAHLTATLDAARLTTIAGMGHALNGTIIPHLAETILTFTGEVDKPEPS